MTRFPFDTVLVALNAADVHRASFIKAILPEAVRQKMAVIGMKVCAQGALLDQLTMEESVGYTLSLPGVSHVIIGCKTETEVDDNARIVREFKPFEDVVMRALEAQTKKRQAEFTYYKK
jgi:predicted aldo/keto reductase-like oxidoreductase